MFLFFNRQPDDDSGPDLHNPQHPECYLGLVPWTKAEVAEVTALLLSLGSLSVWLLSLRTLPP